MVTSMRSAPLRPFMGFWHRLPGPGRIRSFVEGLVRLTVAPADPGKPSPGGRGVGVEVEGARISAGRLGGIADALVDEAAGGPGVQVLRFELDRLVKVARCRGGVVDRELAQPPRDQRFGL